MKQLNFIKPVNMKRCSKDNSNYWKLFIDGAARNNPGPAGAGIIILKNDKQVEKKGFYLKSKTNNQAEYLALLLGIFYLKKYICHGDLAAIISDSELLVKQISGEYRVKNPALNPLHKLAKELLQEINYNVVHVVRAENYEADQMANKGIDNKSELPKDFLDMLREHAILF